MAKNLSGKLTSILKETSRAFYLSLAILPPGPRRGLSLAYLLARAADTLADTDGVSTDTRHQALLHYRASLEDSSQLSRVKIENFQPPHEGEQKLLASAPVLLEELEDTVSEKRSLIQEVVGTLIEGMLWDQQLFSGDKEKNGLEMKELDRYTYLVAGCVGPFWSKMCAWEDPALQHLLDDRNLKTAVSFGKGLQWVNILRDIPRDQAEGRFYLPELRSETFGQKFVRCSMCALGALIVADPYPTLFPITYLRERVAAVLPLVLAYRTLELLFADGGPRAGKRVKVPRWEVLTWVALAPLLCLHNNLLRYLFSQLSKRALSNFRTLEKNFE